MTPTRRHRKALIFCGLAIPLMFSCLCSCFRSDRERTESSQAEPPKSGDRAARKAGVVEVKEYALRGEVRKVQKEAREVMIRHEAIPGFMEAMTMPFRLEDPALLDDLKPGDRVEGKLRVEFEDGQTKDYRLKDLAVTEPALAAPKVLDLGGGAAELRPGPKRLEHGEVVPDFAMTDQDGREFRLSDLRGHVVALTFIYTRCPLPDFCPMMDRKFADLARSIEAFPERAKKIRLLSISFDPDHDTPEVLRKHAQIRGGAPPLWTFAVASHEELARVMGPLGLIYGPGKGEILHNLCTAVIDPEGRLARLEVGSQSNKWSSADLLKTVYSRIPSQPK